MKRVMSVLIVVGSLLTTLMTPAVGDYMIWTNPLNFTTTDSRLTSRPASAVQSIRITTSSPDDLRWVDLGLSLPSNVHVTSTPPTCYESNAPNLPVEGTITLSLRLNFSDISHWIDIGGIGIRLIELASAIGEDLPGVGMPELALAQNAPNPFHPTTLISYEVEREAPVLVEIRDVAGRLVRTLVDEIRPVGSHGVVWDGRDAAGHPVSSGKYFYRVRVNDLVGSRGMLLIR